MEERVTPQDFLNKVRTSSDSELESMLNIATSNMEILVGPVEESDPAENLRKSNEITQKFLNYFKNSSDWQDNKQYWIDISEDISNPDDEKKYEASVRARYEHFKHKDGYSGVMVKVNTNTFGEEGKFATDISLYDLEENPENKGDEKRRVIADTFCELMKFAEKNNMQYVVKHSQWTYTGDRGFLVTWEPEASSSNEQK